MSLHNIPREVLFEKSLGDIYRSWSNKLNRFSMESGVKRTEKRIEKHKDKLDRTGQTTRRSILQQIITKEKQLLSMYKQGLKIAERDDQDKQANKKQLWQMAGRIEGVEDDIIRLRKRFYAY